MSAHFHSLEEVTGYAVVQTRRHGETLRPAEFVARFDGAMKYGAARLCAAEHTHLSTDVTRVLNLYGCQACDSETLAGRNL